jgi:hypothetical protein
MKIENSNSISMHFLESMWCWIPHAVRAGPGQADHEMVNASRWGYTLELCLSKKNRKRKRKKKKKKIYNKDMVCVKSINPGAP